METTVETTHAGNTAERNRVRTLIRFNTLLFHALSTASFLEASVSDGAGRLAAGVTDVEITGWVAKVWQPQSDTRARYLRAYVEAVWPEFDWTGAYEEFDNSLRSEHPVRRAGSANPVVAALERCAIEAQTATFYRAIANCADDPALRELARAAAADHVRCFEFVRSCFTLRAGHRRIGFLAACRIVLETSRTARDVEVATAFRSLAAHWYGTPTVLPLDYQEFLRRMMQLITRHAGLGRVERLLFNPWWRRAVPAVAMAGGTRRPAGAERWGTLKAAA